MKRILAYLLSIIMLLSNINIVYALDDEKVTVVVKSQPYANILLTKNETNLDLTTFEKDIKSGLENQGIDTTNIKFQTIEQKEQQTTSTDLNFASIVNNWTTIGAPTWTATNDGQIYSLVGPSFYGNYNFIDSSIRWSSEYNNGQNGWWGTGLINQNAYDTSNIQMDFTLVKAGSLNEGICFNVTRNSDGSLNGYFFNITEHNGSNSGIYQLRLFKMKNYQLDQSFTSGLNSKLWCWDATHEPQVHSSLNNTSPWIVGEKTIGAYGTYNGPTYDIGEMETIAAWTLPWNGDESLRQNIKYHIEVKDGHIIINMNGTNVVDLYDDTYTKGTYGFWGNNCEQVSSMYLKDFNIKTTQTITKTYAELTQDVGNVFQEGKTNIIVDVDNSVDTSLNSPSVATWTNANGVQFLAWGNNINKNHIENFINKSNDARGKWIDASSYQFAINETINYIVNLLKEDTSNNNQYVIVGQDSTIEVTPSYFKTNAIKDGKGRWHVVHNYTYYDNNLGLSTQTEIDTSDLICNFDKPGEYIIKFDGEEVKRIYAHRLPTVDFSININGNSLNLISQSQDLDSNINNGYGKGIKLEKWYYKTLDDNNWTNGKLTTFDKNKIYLIKLEVEDFQGATTYTTKYVGVGNPIANFNLDSYNFSKYQKIRINDTSYDPQGYTINNWNWSLFKNGSIIETSNNQNPTFDFKSYGIGNYKLTLEVTNNNGTKSNSYSRDFTVIEDTTGPEIVSLSPTNCDWKTGTQTINFDLNDSDSGLKNWCYAITTSETKPNNWSSMQTSSSGSVITPSTTGQYYLHILVYDNANNELYRTFSYYKIDNDKPIINTITLAKDCTNIIVNASDNGSGIKGYALTTNNTPPNINEFQTSNTLKTYKSGTYYVWVIDNVGLISNSITTTINKKEIVNITWDDNNNLENLRPDKVTLTIFRNGTKLKDVQINSSTTSYTFENLDSMDSNGKLYTYTFSLNVNDRYNIKVANNNIIASMKQTTFNVIIPKNITLNGNSNSCNYKVKINGTLYLNDTLTIKPSNSFILKDKNKISNIIATITQNTINFNKNNLREINGSINLNKTKFAGKYDGTFNFAIKLTLKN